MGKYSVETRICDVCGKTRNSRLIDHSACSREMQRRHEAWLDEPAYIPGITGLTNRNVLNGKKKNRAVRRERNLLTGKKWWPE